MCMLSLLNGKIEVTIFFMFSMKSRNLLFEKMHQKNNNSPSRPSQFFTYSLTFFFLLSFIKTMEEVSSGNQIPNMTDLQEGLSSLQIQDTHALPLSPPEDSQTSPLLSHHPPPVSPSQILPTPPPSSESSPMMSLSERDTNHMTNADVAGGLHVMLLWQNVYTRNVEQSLYFHRVE